MMSTTLIRNNGRITLQILLSAWILVGFPSAQSQGESFRRHVLDVSFFSLVPDAGNSSYVSYGSGSSGGHAQDGYYCVQGERRFQVKIKIGLRQHLFGAEVEVAPASGDTLTPLASYEVDLHELKAVSLEIARDEDGRIYLLNFTPGIEITEDESQEFDAAGLKLEAWYLRDSAVILDDMIYLGKITAAGERLAFFDVAGVGKIEFALIRFEGSKPLGELKDRTLRITGEDGTVIDVYNVLNGHEPMELPGGPYRVWVRWSDPTIAAEDAAQATQESLLDLEKRLAEGSLEVDAASLSRLRRRVEQGSPTTMTSYGIRGVKRLEIVE